MARPVDPDAPMCCEPMRRWGDRRWICLACRRTFRDIVNPMGRKPQVPKPTNAQRQQRYRDRLKAKRNMGQEGGTQ